MRRGRSKSSLRVLERRMCRSDWRSAALSPEFLIRRQGRVVPPMYSAGNGTSTGEVSPGLVTLTVTGGHRLVSSGGTVTMLTPTQPGKAPTASALLEGLNRPQGLAFTPDGTTLVVGESHRIVA